MKLSEEVIIALRCPKCLFSLKSEDELLISSNIDCEITFIIINGIPVLINEGNSLQSAKILRLKRT